MLYLSHLSQHQYVLVHVLHVILILKVIVTLINLRNHDDNYYYHNYIGLSAPLSAGITALVTIPVSSIVSSLFTLFLVYLCCGKHYSINTTDPVYDTPLPDSNVTRTSEFEMKSDQAYGHVISDPRYETMTS